MCDPFVTGYSIRCCWGYQLPPDLATEIMYTMEKMFLQSIITSSLVKWLLRVNIDRLTRKITQTRILTLSRLVFEDLKLHVRQHFAYSTGFSSSSEVFASELLIIEPEDIGVNLHTIISSWYFSRIAMKSWKKCFHGIIYI